MQLRYSIALGSLAAVPAFAGGLAVNVELPRLSVAEYHRPYVAVWVERADAGAPPAATSLAAWYDIRTRANNPEGEGTKWLKDLRQWWRRTGRELQMPVDGVTGATRPAGKHQLSFTEGSGPLARLQPGNYKLMVEAARENGGHETVTVPFTWPVQQATQAQQQGSTELGAIALELKP